MQLTVLGRLIGLITLIGLTMDPCKLGLRSIRINRINTDQYRINTDQWDLYVSLLIRIDPVLILLIHIDPNPNLHESIDPLLILLVLLILLILLICQALN